METKTFNYSLTFIGSISLTETYVRALLNLSSTAVLTEEDWNRALKFSIKEKVLDINDIEDFNDVEIEEVS